MLEIAFSDRKTNKQITDELEVLLNGEIIYEIYELAMIMQCAFDFMQVIQNFFSQMLILIKGVHQEADKEEQGKCIPFHGKNILRTIYQNIYSTIIL